MPLSHAPFDAGDAAESAKMARESIQPNVFASKVGHKKEKEQLQPYYSLE
jgi:hypothetical protein